MFCTRFLRPLGQGVGTVLSPAKVVFARIGVLLQAVRDVRDSQEALVDLFGHIEYFFRRLETYIEVQPTAAMTEITVKIMIEIILILGIVTKEIKQGRISMSLPVDISPKIDLRSEKYLKVLIGREDVEGALRGLDKLTQEEARIASAEVLKITHGLKDNVKNVADKVQDVDGTMQGVDERVKGVDDRLLQCLAVSSRPLRVEELADILAVNFNVNVGGVPNFNAAWENQEEAVLSACSSLVSVIGDGGSQVVQFSHFSVKEFLTSDRLVEYAARYWVKHAQFENVEFPIKDAVDQFFDADKPHLPAWVQIYDIEDSLSHLPNLKWDRTPLSYAALCGLYGLVVRHIVKYPQHLRASRGRFGTPLHSSTLQGRTKVAEVLIAHGVDINSREAKDEMTALHFASLLGQLDTAKWLIDHGADVTAQSSYGCIPLHHAAFYGTPDVIPILLDRGAQINARTLESGSTSLHFALRRGRFDTARSLLDRGADANVRDNSGSYPLYLAAAYGNLDIIQMLLERHPEANARNDEGSTPLHTASDAGTTRSCAVTAGPRGGRARA
ncbi:ankyrin repeat-containing domain protein [Lactarius vividus]|nr:ankyrin repeat-containing domain protein [Lactarius vividus]